MKPLIVANWKMNPATHKQAHGLLLDVERGLQLMNSPAAVVLGVPFVYLDSLKGYTVNTKLAAQDCFWEQQGAFTGEVSPTMLKNIACTYVILGHSERKKYLGETEDQVAKKVNAALKAGLHVILCVKDSLELKRLQQKGNISLAKNIVVTYEPPTAISTEEGRRVAPEAILTEVKKIRMIIGTSIPVLYGGSVNAATVGSIMQRGGVQGVLVGAASLKPREFLTLLKKAVLSYSG